MDSTKHGVIERILASPVGRAALAEQHAEALAARQDLIAQRERLAVETSKTLAPLRRRRDQAIGRLEKHRADGRALEAAARVAYSELQSATWRLDRLRDELQREISASAAAEIDTAIAELDARLDHLSATTNGRNPDYDENQLTARNILEAVAQLTELKQAAFDPKQVNRLAAVGAQEEKDNARAHRRTTIRRLARLPGSRHACRANRACG